MSLRISRILHAGYLFEKDQIKIIFDPIFENPFSKNCYAFPSVNFDHEQIKNLSLSAVFISHFHDDHCSLESLDLLDRETPIYLYCVFDELFSWIRGLGFKNVERLKIDKPVEIGPFKITPRRALDVGVDSLFQIQAGDLNVLNVVDSWIDEPTLAKLLDQGPWDVVLWPFQTMRELEVIAPSRIKFEDPQFPPEWEPQLKALNPKYVVPSSCQFQMESWSWYNRAFFPLSYRQFQNWIADILPKTQAVRMNPGVSLTLDNNGIKKSEPLAWIEPIGEQDVDYQLDPGLVPPKTAEISKNFERLAPSETERVLEYCRTELIQKYNSLDPAMDPFFQKPRVWRLALYDHDGHAIFFEYRIARGVIEKAEFVTKVDWFTEVPIIKLYGALERGESLTSMYLRINDTVFEPEAEKELLDVDLIEDPLIRCLFEGVFGAYQLAQLKRLGRTTKT